MPRSVDHDERRREIASATWRAIDELGVEGTTMRAIAERAGCTIGRLNHYFDNREEMLVAALRHAHLQAAARMEVTVKRRSGRGALRAVLLDALPVDDQRRTEWKVWLTFWAEAIATESLREEHRQRYEEWRRLVASLVSAAAPAMRKAQRERVADLLVATIDGLGIEMLMSPQPVSPRRAARMVTSIIDTVLP